MLVRNETSYADRRGNGCSSAPAMQQSGAVDGPASSAVSQDSRAGKHKRSSVDVVHETAPVGAKHPRARARKTCSLVAASLGGHPTRDSVSAETEAGPCIRRHAEECGHPCRRVRKPTVADQVSHAAGSSQNPRMATGRDAPGYETGRDGFCDAADRLTASVWLSVEYETRARETATATSEIGCTTKRLTEVVASRFWR